MRIKNPAMRLLVLVSGKSKRGCNRKCPKRLQPPPHSSQRRDEALANFNKHDVPVSSYQTHRHAERFYVETP
jgi:hypothetical protein